MKTTEELIEEVQKRLSPPMQAMYDAPITWKACTDMLDESADVGLQIELKGHEKLLSIVVCINEKACDAWVEGLYKIWGCYSE